MAATLKDKLAAAHDAAFRDRLLIAMVSGAIGNVGEAAGSTAAEKRTALARDVLANPSAYLERFALAVVQDGTDATSTDAQIIARVAGLWNGLAGVRGGE